MDHKYTPLNDRLYAYLTAQRSHADEEVLRMLREETAQLGEDSVMQISPEQGTLLSLLTAAIGARSAIEVGTFTGYSALSIARALPADGRLICVDQSEEWTAIARRYWEKAGVADRITLRLGPAVPLLQNIEPGTVYDFAFIDADKTEYDVYYEMLLPHIRSNGLIVFDNMLWGGRLGGSKTPEEGSGRAIDALNRKLARDPRVECVLLPIADGLQLCRKL